MQYALTFHIHEFLQLITTILILAISEMSSFQDLKTEMRTSNVMQNWKQGDRSKKDLLVSYLQKLISDLSSVVASTSSAFSKLSHFPNRCFFSSPGRSPDSGYFGMRGVSSESWSAHREGSARHNFLCAGGDRSPAPCWPLAGKPDTGRGFPPGESQHWQFKAMCVLINF